MAYYNYLLFCSINWRFQLFIYVCFQLWKEGQLSYIKVFVFQMPLVRFVYIFLSVHYRSYPYILATISVKVLQIKHYFHFSFLSTGAIFCIHIQNNTFSWCLIIVMCSNDLCVIMGNYKTSLLSSNLFAKTDSINIWY